MAEPATFVLVGHCGPDAHLLKSAVSRAVPGCTVVRADNERDLQARMGRGVVMLVNRVLDGDFDAEDGIELIAAIRASDDPPTSVLISNFADAQAKAVAAGARQGFGKSAVYAESTAIILQEAAKVAMEDMK